MNLFDYYKNPEELENYKKAHNVVPELVRKHVLAQDDINDTQKKTIENDPELALLYSQYYYEKWPEGSKGEQSISKNPAISLRYSTEHGKWPEGSLGHKAVASNPHTAVAYAVNHGKWKEGSKEEEMVASHPQSAKRYADRYGKWPEGSKGEQSIASKPILAVQYARKYGKRWPEGSEAEENIAKDAKSSYEYAINVIRDKWPTGEKAIAKDSHFKQNYNDFLIGRGYDDQLI